MESDLFKETIYKYVQPIILWYNSVEESCKNEMKVHLLLRISSDIRKRVYKFTNNDIPLADDILRQTMENICIIYLAFGIDLYKHIENVKSLLKNEPSECKFINENENVRVEGQSTTEDVQGGTLNDEAQSTSEDVQGRTLNNEAQSTTEDVQGRTLNDEAPSTTEDVQGGTLNNEAPSTTEDVQGRTLNDEAPSTTEVVQGGTLNNEEQSTYVIKSIRKVICDKNNQFKEKYFNFSKRLHDFVAKEMQVNKEFVGVFLDAENNLEWCRVKNEFINNNEESSTIKKWADVGRFGKNVYNYIPPILVMDDINNPNHESLKLIVEMRNTACHHILTGDCMQELFVNMIKVYKGFDFDLFKKKKISDQWNEIVDEESFKIKDEEIKILISEFKKENFYDYFKELIQFLYGQRKTNLFKELKESSKTDIETKKRLKTYIKTVYRYVAPIILWHQNIWYDSVHEIFKDEIKNNYLFKLTSDIRHCVGHFSKYVKTVDILRQIMENICIVYLAFGIDLYKNRVFVGKLLNGEQPSKYMFINVDKKVKIEGQSTSENVHERTLKVEAQSTSENDSKRTLKVEVQSTIENDIKRTIKVEAQSTIENDSKRTLKVEGQFTIENDSKRTLKVGGQSTIENDIKRTIKVEGQFTIENDSKITLPVEGQSISENCQYLTKDDVIEHVKSFITHEYNPWKEKYFLFGTLLHHFVTTKMTNCKKFTEVFLDAKENVEWSSGKKRFIIDKKEKNIYEQLIFKRVAPLFVWIEVVKSSGNIINDIHQQFNPYINDVGEKINCWIDNKCNVNEEINILNTMINICEQINSYSNKPDISSSKKYDPKIKCYNFFNTLVKSYENVDKQKRPSFIFKISNENEQKIDLKKFDILNFCGLFYICCKYFENKSEVSNDSFYTNVKNVTDNMTKYLKNEIVQGKAKDIGDLQPQIIKGMESLFKDIRNLDPSKYNVVHKLFSQLYYFIVPSIFKEDSINFL